MTLKIENLYEVETWVRKFYKLLEQFQDESRYLVNIFDLVLTNPDLTLLHRVFI